MTGRRNDERRATRIRRRETRANTHVHRHMCWLGSADAAKDDVTVLRRFSGISTVCVRCRLVAGGKVLAAADAECTRAPLGRITRRTGSGPVARSRYTFGTHDLRVQT